MQPSKWNAAELLAECLETGEEAAWAEFISRYQPLIAGVIGKIVSRRGGARTELIDDLVQETYLRLCRDSCKALRNFKPEREESIFGFLKVVASSATLDYFRNQAATKRGPETAVLDEVTERYAVSHERSADSQAERAEMWRYVESVAQSERDSIIFRLYYEQGFTTKEIAALPDINLSAKGVESCLKRITGDMQHALRPNLKQEGQRREISFGDMP